MAGTLKARVSGAWVPVIGSGQEAAATARWNSAWGVIGQAIVTANQGGIQGTAVAITGATVTINAVAGRRYRISWEGSPFGDTADQVGAYYLAKDGSQVQAAPFHLRVAGMGTSTVIEFHDAPTAGSHTYSISMVRATGAGTLTNGGTATQPSTLTVLDVGPVTMASIAPPTAGPYVVASGNALGIVAMGALDQSVGAVAANTAATMTFPLVFTPQVGRRYRLQYVLRAMSVTVANYTVATMWMDGAGQYPAVGDRYQQISTNGYQAHECYWEFDGDGVQHSYLVKSTPGAAGTVTMYPSPGGLFYIEDVGPNQSPALPLPATAPAWTQITPTSPWTNVAGKEMGYRKIGDLVYLRGYVIGGAVANPIATLPVGFRPPTNHEWIAYQWPNTPSFCQVYITPAGLVQVNTITGAPAGLNNVTFANCVFSVTP